MSHRIHSKGSNNNVRLPGVAPSELVREDFRALDAKEVLRTSWEVEQTVLIQTVEGHAYAGHGLFYGRRYPNTTLEDICRALKLDPEEVKAHRQCLIDEVRDFAERVAAGERPIMAANRAGEPLMRVGALRAFDIDPVGVLKGLYVGGLRDTAEIRKQAEEIYGARIGFGQSYLVNQTVMHAMGLTGEMLARQGHEHEMDMFKKRGLIADEPGKDASYMYIRHRTGPGASDDAAVVMAGKLYGLSAAIGSFLSDAVDTLEKFVPVYDNQDAGISDAVEKCPGMDLTTDDAVKIAYLSAASEEEYDTVPDSSLRHLLSIDRKTDICALESHLLYVVGKPVPEIELDHGQCTNYEFYDYIERRLATVK